MGSRVRPLVIALVLVVGSIALASRSSSASASDLLASRLSCAAATGSSVLGWLAQGSFRRARFPGFLVPPPALSADAPCICDFCHCEKPRDGEWWWWKPRLRDAMRPSGPARTSADLGPHIRAAVLEALCPHIHVRDPSVFMGLLKASPEWTMAWDVAGLVPLKPTVFAFTKTAMVGGKLTPGMRRAYFDRHVQTILRHRENVERQGYSDGAPASSRQVVWIIVEDNDRLDPNIVSLMRDSGVNFIYFAYGPTRSWGNAQHNAAFTLMHALTDESRPVLGHGPIFSMDDDAEIHEDLFDWVWKMGNLGPTGFEGPTWDEAGQKIISWNTTDDPTRQRLYPIDNGAFAINTSLLGTEIDGPAFWPEDTDGGETEFLGSFLSGRDDLERVCGPCHVAWHNRALSAEG